MLLFRRRPKESPPEEKGNAPEAAASRPRDEGPAATPPARPPGAGAPATSGVPPPLPRRAPEAASSDAPATYSRCFVCGSTLEAGACPVCQIAWVE